jgi:hypothetical protein
MTGILFDTPDNRRVSSRMLERSGSVTFRNSPDTGGEHPIGANIEPCQPQAGNVAG